MIESALRKRLQPVVDRRRHIVLAWRLAVCWLIVGLAGAGLMGVRWLWGWSSPAANVVVWMGAAGATLWAIYRYRRMQPDYKAIAENIERQNPDLKALLLTAIEQKAKGPEGELGYLQEWVIREALVHAMRHDWLQSIPARTLMLVDLGAVTGLLFLAGVLMQLSPVAATGPVKGGGAIAKMGYQVTVSPGDARVEVGTPVVIMARFDGRVPTEASLLFGQSAEDPATMTADRVQQIVLTKNLEDPVFGGIIPEVKQDLVYHIEYAGRRTRDYRISVFEYPALTRADARIVYPAYTQLPEKVLNDTRQVSALEGSQIYLTFTFNKALAKARLAPRGGAAVAGPQAARSQVAGPQVELTVDPERPNVYTAALTAGQSQQYEVRLVDAEGLSNKPPAPRFSIQVHKNLPPELAAVFPRRDVTASPLEELTLEAEVSDDFGVMGYGVSYMLAGMEGKEIRLSDMGTELGSERGRDALATRGRDALATAKVKQKFRYLLSLEELNAQPDQVLTYYFWADDIGPDGQTRRVASDMYFAEVRPFEEIYRESGSFMDEQQQREQERQNQSGEGEQGQRAEQLARLQKQIITATWNVKQAIDLAGKGKDHIDDVNVVQQSQADVLKRAQSALAEAEDAASGKALQAATKHMETSLEHLGQASESGSSAELASALGAEQSAYQELLKLRQREYQVAQSRSASRRNSASNRYQQQLDQLELQQRDNRYETERRAQSQEQTNSREDLQVLNRLRDLARRQNEVSEKLKEAQTSLQQARNETQRQEALRELRRLRDEQLQSLQDADELQQRMESPQNRQRMSDAREQLGQSRSRIQQSAEELEQGMVSQAITSATRAQRQLEQMQEDLERNTSSEFVQEMRSMRQQAQELDQREREIGQEIQQQVDSRQKTLADSGVSRQLAERIDQQRKNTGQLLDQMKDVSEQSEASEPLLSRRLYDALRTASTENMDRALEVTSELVRRSFLPQAQEVERQAGQGIERLRRGVEEAAQSVLGDEAQSLRLARQQLDELIRQLNSDAARAGQGQQEGSDANQPGLARAGQRTGQDANEPAQAGEPGQAGEPNQTGERRVADARSAGGEQGQGESAGETPATGSADEQRGGGRAGQRGQDRQLADQRGQRGQGRGATDQTGQNMEPANAGRGGAGPEAAGDNRGGQRGAPRRGQQPVEVARGGELGPRGRADPRGWGGNQGVIEDVNSARERGPLTGDNYGQWSDRLRDVEEMLSEEDMRNEAARVRDRARAIRAEFTRHGTQPQWELVQQQITKPLAELRERVSQRLAQIRSEDAMVPIDRDPVPGRYTELVRKYFENLGNED